jgi:hypothetical protein
VKYREAVVNAVEFRCDEATGAAPREDGR